MYQFLSIVRTGAAAENLQNSEGGVLSKFFSLQVGITTYQLITHVQSATMLDGGFLVLLLLLGLL